MFCTQSYEACTIHTQYLLIACTYAEAPFQWTTHYSVARCFERMRLANVLPGNLHQQCAAAAAAAALTRHVHAHCVQLPRCACIDMMLLPPTNGTHANALNLIKILIPTGASALVRHVRANLFSTHNYRIHNELFIICWLSIIWDLFNYLKYQ